MSELLQAGLTVTVIGVTTVFVLLTLLVYVVELMSWISRAVVEKPAHPEGAAAPVDDEIVSVISSAVGTYRRRHKR
jgi:sodium pump decarboxylase gamma subunit